MFGQVAAITYVIARMNFLFDKAKPYFLTTEIICEFFGTKKTSCSNRTSLIEKSCNFGLAEPGYCTREISEKLSFVQLPNGMIISERMFREIYSQDANEVASRGMKSSKAENHSQQQKDARKAKKERHEAINRATAAKKKRKEQEEDRLRQPNLFGD